MAGGHESKPRRKNHIPDNKPAVSKTEREKNKGNVRTNIPLGDCSWCSDVDEESEALLSFSRSFSKDMSLEFLCSAEKATEESKKNSEMENVKKARRLRRHALKTELSTAGSSNASVLRRMVTCTANGKVRESFAVVKRTAVRGIQEVYDGDDIGEADIGGGGIAGAVAMFFVSEFEALSRSNRGGILRH